MAQTRETIFDGPLKQVLSPGVIRVLKTTVALTGLTSGIDDLLNGGSVGHATRVGTTDVAAGTAMAWAATKKFCRNPVSCTLAPVVGFASGTALGEGANRALDRYGYIIPSPTVTPSLAPQGISGVPLLQATPGYTVDWNLDKTFDSAQNLAEDSWGAAGEVATDSAGGISSILDDIPKIGSHP